MDKYAVWVKAKPEFDRECTFVTAHLIKDVWDFNSWRIIKVDSEDGWYWALCNIDGEEWGPLEDLSAQLYYVLPNPDESPVDRGVEKAEDYAAIRYPFVALDEKSLVADNAIIEACRIAYIAGAKLAANDALSLIKFVRNLEYMNGTKPQHEFSEQEIYNLFKQKQL